MSRAILDLDERIRDETAALQNITDAQFKIINESIIALSETVEEEKISYLKGVVLATIQYDDYSSYESILISRIIRDISVEEIRFLVENLGYDTVNIYSWHDPENNSEKQEKDVDDLRLKISSENGLLVLPNEPKALVVSGLVNLGVLVPGQLALGVYMYRFADISTKLVALLRRR